jgi:hypothetical protein
MRFIFSGYFSPKRCKMPRQTCLGILGKKLVRFTDLEITDLINEPKKAPTDIFDKLAKMRHKRGHSELNLDISAESGNQYRLIIRQNKIYTLDFSVIIALIPLKTNQVFRLRRYNGKSHQHRNIIEKTSPFYNFHIHMATERYQELGMAEDAYAEQCELYHDTETALRCLISDCSLHGEDLPLLRGI